MDDSGIIPHLKCDVELELSGPSVATLNRRVALQNPSDA